MALLSLLACEKSIENETVVTPKNTELNLAQGYTLIDVISKKAPEYWRPQAIQGKYKGKITVTVGECGEKEYFCGADDYILIPFKETYYKHPEEIASPIATEMDFEVDVKISSESPEMITIIPRTNKIDIAHSYARLIDCLYPASIEFNTNSKPYSLYYNNPGYYETAPYGRETGISIPAKITLREKEKMATIEAKKIFPSEQKVKLREWCLENNSKLLELAELKRKTQQLIRIT